MRSPNFSATRPQLLSIRGATTIKPEQIDWRMLEDLGLSHEELEANGVLEKMLSWKKSDLLPIAVPYGNSSIYTEARLAFTPTIMATSA